MEQPSFMITVHTTDDFQRCALEMILLHMATALASFEEDDHQLLEVLVYYTENNGFAYRNDETGSFIVRFPDRKLTMQTGLMKSGSVVSFFHREGQKLQYHLGSFYQSDPDHLDLSPFRGRRDFLRFRKALFHYDENMPIGRITA